MEVTSCTQDNVDIIHINIVIKDAIVFTRVIIKSNSSYTVTQHQI